MGWIIVKLIEFICRKMDKRKTNEFFRKAQIGGGAAMAFMHGAQDGQKFMGVFMLGMFLAQGNSTATEFTIPIWLMILCSVIMALGTSIGGYRIIKSVGMDMVNLKQYQGFSADLAAALCLFTASVTGLPVSTTHTKTTAIMGVGAAVIFAIMLIGGQSMINVTPNWLVWLGSGALIGLGVIVPGMSPSNFLIYFGLYDKMAAGIKDFDFAVIVPLTLGLIVCVLVFAKAAAWAFDHYYAGMYHFILGMVIGSSLAIFPTVVFPTFTASGLAEANLSLPVALIFAIVMFIVGTIASWLFSKLEDKVAIQREAIEAAAS